MFNLTRSERNALIFVCAFLSLGAIVKNFSVMKKHAYSPQKTYNAKQSAVININKASIKELVELKGVGTKTAAAIVEYRQVNGPFLSKDDLISVPGIGPKKLSQIKNNIKL